MLCPWGEHNEVPTQEVDSDEVAAIADMLEEVLSTSKFVVTNQFLPDLLFE